MRAIVVGAGIGGASAAIALARLGHEVVVHEQVRENKPVGAGLSLWSNGVKVLNWLGLGAEVAHLGGRMDDMAYLDGHTGETLCRFSLSPVTAQTGQRPYPVARADLQSLLLARLGPDRVRLGSRLVGLADDGTRVTATFADGSTDVADLLIAADGARSFAREYVTAGSEGEARIERRYAGYVNYNGLVAVDEAIGPANQWTTYVADGKRCAVMPVGGERFYFFADVPQPAGLPHDRASGTGPLRESFGDWAPGVRRLLDAIDPAASLNRVEIWDIDPFHTWVRGRVALLGDAAHASVPDIGQGACSALEDSFALAISLATNTISVEDSLVRYQRIRSPRAADLVLRARKRCRETHGLDPQSTRAWYEGLRSEDGSRIIRGIVSAIDASPVNLGGAT